MALGIVKLLIFGSFVNLFDCSEKLTSQIRYCGFREITGSGKSSALAGTNTKFYIISYRPLKTEILIFSF